MLNIWAQTCLSKNKSVVSSDVKFNLNHFKSIRHQLSHSAAKLFVHTMIFPHLSYCITTWSQAGVTTLQPVHIIYKQILKVLDKKPRNHHYCNILKNVISSILITPYFTYFILLILL